MKELVLHLMKFNRDANKKVISILDGLTEEQRTEDQGAFFKSMHGILDHIAGGGFFFQRMIKLSYPESECLSHKYTDYKTEHGKINFVEFEQLKDVLDAIDSAFVCFVDKLANEDLKKTIKIVSPRGTSETTLGLFLLRFVNHGTHHRGQISQILDEMKIENDFSGIAEKYE